MKRQRQEYREERREDRREEHRNYREHQRELIADIALLLGTGVSRFLEKRT